MKTKNMNKIIVILMLFISGLVYGQVDPSIIWSKNYGGSSEDIANDMIMISNNKLTFVGSSQSSDFDVDTNYGNRDVWVSMLDLDGNLIWEKSFGNTNDEYASKIVQHIDGTLLVGGNTGVSSSIYEKNAWLLQLDTQGNLIQQKFIGDTLHGELIRDITISNDSNIYVLSTSYTNATSWPLCDVRVTKFNPDLILIWDTVYTGLLSGNDYPSNILESKNNNFLITYNSRYVTLGALIIDEFANVIDTFIYNEAMNNGFNNALKVNNEIYLVGNSDATTGIFTSRNLGLDDGFLIRTDTNNNIINNFNYGGSNYDVIESISPLQNNRLLVCGSTSSIDHDLYYNNGLFYDGWIMELDSIGNKIWSKNYGSSGPDNFIKAISHGEYIHAVGLTMAADYDIPTYYDSTDVWILKIKRPTHIVSGKIFADINSDCILDTSTDIGIKNIILNNSVNNYNVLSQINGEYLFLTYTDTLCISVINVPINSNISCLTTDTIYMYFDSTSSLDSSNVNIPLDFESCHFLNVDISHDVLRLCRYSQFIINYNNRAINSADSAYIILILDTLNIDSISSITPYTISGDSIRFNLGDVGPFEYNTISFTAHVKCSATIGTSACTRAYIYPLNNCPPTLVGYDSSDIEVMTRCSNDTVHVEVKNRVGAQDMTLPGRIIAIEDEIIQQAEPFILNAGLSVNYDYYVNPDRTLTIKVEQNPNHPTRPIIILHDELCALTTPIKLNSVIDHFSRYDEANEYEEVCGRILASCDPNIKSVVPQGFTSQHYTDSNQILEYRIDFQNIGLDTAQRVLIADTLSKWLDVSTFVPLVSSHSYTTVIEGTRVVKFIFDPILLPDSNASEPNSRGYVTFKIRPKFNTPKGTMINNFADIYFDFNAPVRTNTVFNTIYDTVLVRLGVGLNEPKENQQAHVLVFPNPTVDKFFVKLDNDIQGAQIKLLDINGREVYQMNNVSGKDIEMKASDLSKGIYFINIYDKNKLIGRSKIIVQ